MSRVKMLSLFSLVLIVSACGILNPYIDRRRNPGTSDISKLYTGKSTPSAPVICYNPLLTDDEELQAIADAECQKHEQETHAVYQETQSFSCTLLLPSASFYKCEK